jgi:hypothetical protein
VAQTGKRLTFSPDGATNSTVVALDGRTAELGCWGTGEHTSPLPRSPLHTGQAGLRSSWSVGGVEFTQAYELVPSKQPVTVEPGVQRRLVDTLLIR